MGDLFFPLCTSRWFFRNKALDFGILIQIDPEPVFLYSYGAWAAAPSSAPHAEPHDSARPGVAALFCGAARFPGSGHVRQSREFHGAFRAQPRPCLGPADSPHLIPNHGSHAMWAQSGFDITGQGTILSSSAPAPAASAPVTPVKLSAAQIKEVAAAERRAKTARCAAHTRPLTMLVPLHATASACCSRACCAVHRCLLLQSQAQQEAADEAGHGGAVGAPDHGRLHGPERDRG